MDINTLILDGKNSKTVICKRCPSVILKPGVAQYQNIEFELPLLDEKDASKTEFLSDYWLVHNMMNFENCGFTYSVGNYKYLACADCEGGPIGLHDTHTKKSYVSLKRVQYK